MINILIADDSATSVQLLKSIFASTDDMHVIGCAQNGKEAVELAIKLNPTIITMDIQMPMLDGIEATKKIMSEHPTPIVVISSKLNDSNLNMTFLALEAGALGVIEKPINITSPTFAQQKQRIIKTIRSMSEIRVVTKRFHVKPDHTHHKLVLPTTHKSYEIVAIGSSVGGPQALKCILSRLPANFSVPIVIVQHMTNGFIHGFSKWLNDNSPLQVKEAENMEVLKGGVVYLAPDDFHLEVTRSQQQLMAKLISAPPVSGFCPSITQLFNSIAKNIGENAIGVLLTGMGSDGAHGMLEMKKAHSHTLIQDEQSAVVFGMAGVAQSLGAVDQVVELDRISDYLVKLLKCN